MNSPFEELEYLADFLPEEGEAVVVSRRSGELICEPFRQEPTRAGVTDPEFYGRLVQANDRLRALSGWPLWVCAMGAFWLCVAVHKLATVGWDYWFLDVGIVLAAVLGYVSWIAFQRRKMFRDELRPMVEREIRRRGLEKFSVIGAVRQHPELRSLMGEFSQWTERIQPAWDDRA